VGKGHCVVCNIGRCTECAAPDCTVQCTVFSVHCAMCSVQCAVCSVHCAACRVQSAVCGGQCSLVSVECAMGSTCNGSVPYEVCIVHSAPLNSILLFLLLLLFYIAFNNPNPLFTVVAN
jgi:hypothetical protein